MFTWKFLELFANSEQLVSVTYLLSGTDGINTVESKGKHTFSDGIVNKPFNEIVEQDLINWLEKEHSEDGEIKQNLQNQLKNLEINQKVEFPWLANTFTI